jgi:hypothetical protein
VVYVLHEIKKVEFLVSEGGGEDKVDTLVLRKNSTTILKTLFF